MMEKNLPEILLGTSDKAQAQRVSRMVRSGRLRKICPRVYTSNLTDADGVIVRRNLFPVLGGLFPGALVSHRSALEGGPTTDGHIFLTHSYTRKRTLPGITVHLVQGPRPSPEDNTFVNGLFIASQPRAFLENLQPSRGGRSTAKSLTKSAVEDRLDQLCRVKGEGALNELRDSARVRGRELGMTKEFARLDAMIGAILRTHPAGTLTSRSARSRAVGLPYDSTRLPVLNALLSALLKDDLPARRVPRINKDAMALFAFYESYFSNYIEGTEFGIDEAYDLVFHQKMPANRPEDAHDITGTFRIAGNPGSRMRVPDSYGDFIEILTAWHHTLLEARPDRAPGQLKMTANRAGRTEFVAPELVRGTLLQGYEMYQGLAPGLPRAIFVMFLVLEVHPFTDGNGRIARLMLNAELSRRGLCRILIPTVFRDDYLAALRALSRSANPAPLVRSMDYAQQFSSAVPLSSYAMANEMLIRCNAFMDPDEAHLTTPSRTSLLPRKPARR